jgi:hypothetical protein
MLFALLSVLNFPTLSFGCENTVQRGSRDSEPFRGSDIIFHGFIHGFATDDQHMGAAQKVAANVDAVLVLLRDILKGSYIELIDPTAFRPESESAEKGCNK